MPNATKKMWKMNETAIWVRAASSGEKAISTSGPAEAAARQERTIGLCHPPSASSSDCASFGPHVPGAYAVHRLMVREDRIDDAPRGQCRVLAREQHAVAIERVAKQTLVR